MKLVKMAIFVATKTNLRKVTFGNCFEKCCNIVGKISWILQYALQLDKTWE